MINLKNSPTIQTTIVIVTAFAAQFIGGVTGHISIEDVSLALPVEQDPWTVITSVYTHLGFGHLTGNLIALLIFGLLVERYTSVTKFHLFFIFTGVVAGLSQVFITGTLFSVSPSVLGASGAIFALMGYFVTGNVAMRGIADKWEIGLLGKMIFVVVVGTILTIVTAGEGVALFAHAVGFILGGVAGFFKLLHEER